MNNCVNCNEPVTGNYCSNCGQPAKLKRIDGRYIIQEIGSFFYADKGMLYTIKKVLLSPGESVNRFLSEDRNRYMKPITFLFATSLVYTFVCYFYHIGAKDFYINQQSTEIELFPTVNLFLQWMIDYQGYAGIISGFFVAFFVKIFFRKSGYNIFEIFILLCFISGISALFSSVVIIIQSAVHLNFMNIIGLIWMIYYAWAIGQFFNKKKAGSYIKAFIACMLGYFIFGIIVAFVGMFIDFATNENLINEMINQP